MVTTAFPAPRARARALGIWSAVAGVGGALGGVIGGVLTGLLSWRWVLIVNVPLGVLLLGLGAWALVEGPRRPARGRLDLPGSAAVTLGTGCLVGAIIGVQQWGWTSAATLALFGVAVVLLVAFVGIERRAAHPLVPLSVFRIRSVSVANSLSLLGGGVLPATFFFVSLHLQQVLGMTPLVAGLAMVPAAAGIAAGSICASRLLHVLGSRALMLSGSVLAAASLIWLSRLSATGGYVADIPLPLLLAMFGMGLTGLPLTMGATSGLRADQHGLAAGLLNTSRQLGGAIGLAGLVAVASTRTGSLAATGVAPDPALVGGFRTAWLVGAALVLLTGLLGLALPRTTRTPPVPPPEVLHG
jgi:predicted MFS family arabinose efflux permease